jgi:hypothetical protein
MVSGRRSTVTPSRDWQAELGMRLGPGRHTQALVTVAAGADPGPGPPPPGRDGHCQAGCLRLGLASARKLETLQLLTGTGSLPVTGNAQYPATLQGQVKVFWSLVMVMPSSSNLACHGQSKMVQLVHIRQ